MPGRQLGPRASRLAGRLLRVVGPGLVVMLADTDAASVLTAAQSGRDWGYRLLILQLLLVPVMYVAQELSVRLGLSTGFGFLEFVRRRFGRCSGLVLASLLMVSCFGALVTELCGLAGVGQLFGIAVPVTTACVAAAIFAMFVTHSYGSVERVAVLLGLFELAFVVAACRAHPHTTVVWADLRASLLVRHDYLLLVAANVGTSVMPWTIAYQQSALVAKGLGPGDLRAARLDTFFGAVVCQVITGGILVTAASSRAGEPSAALAMLESIPQIAQAFVPLLGPSLGPILFGLALGGAALVATIVVCLTAAWAVCEVTGVSRSLDATPRQAPWLYGILLFFLLAGAGVVSSGVDLVDLSVNIGAWNAVLLPVVLGLLVLAARDRSCGKQRLSGGYAVAVTVLLAAASGLGLFSCLASLAMP